MKLLEIMRIVFLPKWSKKNIEDAARGFSNGSCDDSKDVELKAFLDIASENHKSGHWGLLTYLNYIVNEINLAIKK